MKQSNNGSFSPQMLFIIGEEIFTFASAGALIASFGTAGHLENRAVNKYFENIRGIFEIIVICRLQEV